MKTHHIKRKEEENIFSHTQSGNLNSWFQELGEEVFTIQLNEVCN